MTRHQQQTRVSARKRTSDVWWKNAVVYCLDVETFYDTNGDGCGDFQGLTERIDYLSGLGVTCIWLMPFYPSPGRDDGYDIIDHYGVDGRLGTLGDFAAFVRTARDRGIRVIADLVVNHVSINHAWFRSARHGRDAPFHDFFVWRDERPEDPGEVIFPGEESSIWTYEETCGRWYKHQFYAEQPDLDTANPAVRDALVQVAAFWLQQGLSGFRIDAVPFFVEEVGAPHDLLRDLRAFLTRRDGEVALLGEVNLHYDEQLKYFGDHGEQLHLMFDFVGNQALYLSLARGSAAPLRRALEDRPVPPADCQYANFARNHDELTLDKLSPAERDEVFAAFAPDEDMRLYGRGIRRRVPSMCGGDAARIRLVYSLVFSLPGTPVLFYGEELGMRENLEIPGRLAVRTPMRWSPEAHAGFSPAPDGAELVRPLADDGVDVATQRRDADSALNWIERIVRLRRQCPELGWGAARLLEADEDAVLAHRCDWGDRTVIAVHNFSGDPVTVVVDLDEDAVGLVDLFAQDDLAAPESGRIEVEIEPYGAHWYRVRRQGQRIAL